MVSLVAKATGIVVPLKTKSPVEPTTAIAEASTVVVKVVAKVVSVTIPLSSVAIDSFETATSVIVTLVMVSLVVAYLE